MGSADQVAQEKEQKRERRGSRLRRMAGKKQQQQQQQSKTPKAPAGAGQTHALVAKHLGRAAGLGETGPIHKAPPLLTPQGRSDDGKESRRRHETTNLDDLQGSASATAPGGEAGGKRSRVTFGRKGQTRGPQPVPVQLEHSKLIVLWRT